MKRKTCLALLALSGGFMIAFAASVDNCTEKFNSCTQSCGNEKARCKARASKDELCESRFQECSRDCDKALKDCQAKK